MSGVPAWWGRSEVVVEPPGTGPGCWAGAPSAVLLDGLFHLAYRLRRPVGSGRGVSNVVAESADGLRFLTRAVVSRERFVTDSLERPALVRTPAGRWRLYVSLATPGTKHWRVDLLEADSVEGLATAPARTVLPGSADEAVKDPVVVMAEDGWHLWASVHPLTDPDATDRMTTRYATSDDGVRWTWRATAMAGRPGEWDARGVRVSAVLRHGPGWRALYDGRATAAENWEERTGVAIGPGPDRLTATGVPLRAPAGTGGLRYASAVPLPDGTVRWYLEAARDDGAHELRTVVLGPEEMWETCE